jgi:hypothetical protein
MIPASTGPRPAHRSLNQGQASTDADEPRRAPTSSRRSTFGPGAARRKSKWMPRNKPRRSLLFASQRVIRSA